MKSNFFKIFSPFALSLCCVLLCTLSAAGQQGQKLLPWKEGQLDIYQISTGMGNASFCILPDGTTLLIEAGAINEEYPRAVPPIPHPNASHSPATWISRFILTVMPPANKQIDYALLTHFHDDHMGAPNAITPGSLRGNYKLTGITEVGEIITIKKMIDRGWPDYSYPSVLANPMVDNYRSFLNWQAQNNGLIVEKFQTGRNDQIALVHRRKKYRGSFEIRNVASNGDIWAGKGQTTKRLFPELSVLKSEDYPNENSCSNVLKISYGKFNYFNGGDIFGIPDPGKPTWLNVEDPISKIVGPVEVQVVNHHGYKDSQTETWIRNLQPQVFVLPAWASVHPDVDVLKRMMSEKLYPGRRDIFLTSILKESAAINQEVLSQLKSINGHVLVRVEPGGKKFHVIVIDNNDELFRVKEVFGPYTSR